MQSASGLRCLRRKRLSIGWVEDCPFRGSGWSIIDRTFQRVEPVGYDAKGNTYWLFDDNRLYREAPPPAPQKAKSKKRKSVTKPEPNWILECLTMEDWTAFADKFGRSKNGAEKEFHEFLTEHALPKVLTDLQDKDKTKKMQDALLNRKRSSRLQMRELEKLEMDRQDELRRIQEEEERRNRQLEAKRAREELEKQRRVESRERRIAEREARLAEQRHNQEMIARDRETRLEQRKGGTPAGQRSARKRARKEEEEEENWYFDCVCGTHGENLDAKAQGQPASSVNIADWQKLDYVCNRCKRREVMERASNAGSASPASAGGTEHVGLYEDHGQLVVKKVRLSEGANGSAVADATSVVRRPSFGSTTSHSFPPPSPAAHPQQQHHSQSGSFSSSSTTTSNSQPSIAATPNRPPRPPITATPTTAPPMAYPMNGLPTHQTTPATTPMTFHTPHRPQATTPLPPHLTPITMPPQYAVAIPHPASPAYYQPNILTYADGMSEAVISSVDVVDDTPYAPVVSAGPSDQVGDLVSTVAMTPSKPAASYFADLASSTPGGTSNGMAFPSPVSVLPSSAAAAAAAAAARVNGVLDASQAAPPPQQQQLFHAPGGDAQAGGLGQGSVTAPQQQQMVSSAQPTESKILPVAEGVSQQPVQSYSNGGAVTSNVGNGSEEGMEGA
ncbi:hypothetical protein HDV00_011429 [Rhizophlyctis rosea]|nr:hypothetical protein HDV00_011429 [Rhizophlyctis rosea]